LQNLIYFFELYPDNDQSTNLTVKIEFGRTFPTFGKYTSQVSKWSDVSIPNFDVIIKILIAVNIISCILEPNVPLGSFNTIRSGDINLSSAEITGYIV